MKMWLTNASGMVVKNQAIDRSLPKEDSQKLGPMVSWGFEHQTAGLSKAALANYCWFAIGGLLPSRSRLCTWLASKWVKFPLSGVSPCRLSRAIELI